MPARLNASSIALGALLVALSGGARADQNYLFDAPARTAAVESTSAPALAAEPAPKAAPDSDTRRETPEFALAPDESALRYYASRNETPRVDAEIARLKRFYPTWQAPKDLYDAPALGGEDEADLWDLYAADRMADLDAAIVARQTAEPGWRPSPDLQQKIRRKASRLKIADYLKQGRWQDIVDYVHHVDAAADAEVDVLWAVAEAFARTKQAGEAQHIYHVILTGDKKPDERLATIQKAMAVLRMADVEPLITMGVQRADGTTEFAPILVDITRARVAAYLHDERQQDVADADLRLFQDFARAAADPNQPGLVAWYSYKHKNYPDALEWFKLSLAHGGDAMIAHGLAHSLRALGYMREAEEVAYAWREPLVNNSILFIDILETDLSREIPPYIEPERLFRYAEESLRVASGDGAQALAWYAYNTCQFTTALAWFERANAWRPKEATAYGYALTLRRLRRHKEFFDVVNRYDGLFPKVVALIFPDNAYHPPTPCERRDVARAEAQARMIGDVPVPAPSMLRPDEAPARSEMEIKRRDQYETTRRPDRMPKIARSDFPVGVDMQNDLRFTAFNDKAAPLPATTSDATLVHDTTDPNNPLVARRVPGVGPMPYERYGFMLLPAYDGQTAASRPHSASYAAAGTPWAEQQVEAASAPTAPQMSPDLRNLSPLLLQQKRADQSASGETLSFAPGAPSALASAAGGAYQYGAR